MLFYAPRAGKVDAAERIAECLVKAMDDPEGPPYDTKDYEGVLYGDFAFLREVVR